MAVGNLVELPHQGQGERIDGGLSQRIVPVRFWIVVLSEQVNDTYLVPTITGCRQQPM